MAEDTALPTLPQTVSLEGSQVEGDPLEFMRAKAKENIQIVEKHPIVKDPEKLEFKKYVLEKLEKNIKQFTEIDKQAAEKKAQEEAKKTAEGEAVNKDEDPFADIFKDEPETPDEALQEKQKIAGEFALNTKNYREKFLKELIRNEEQQAKKKDEAKLGDILGKLNNL